MSEKHTDPQIMEHNIRNVMDHWTTIAQDDLTNFFNTLRAEAWHEGFCIGEQVADREPPANPHAMNPYRGGQR